MRALLALLLAPALAAAKNYGRKGHCIAVTATSEHLGGDLRIISSVNGDCRRTSNWWKGTESSGHFRVDAGCKLTLYSSRSCSRRRGKGTWTVADATGKSKSRTLVTTNLKDLGRDNWIRASKCECSGPAYMRRLAGEEEEEEALSLARAANRSVLAEEEEEDEEEEDDEEDEEDEGGLSLEQEDSVLVEEKEEEEPVEEEEDEGAMSLEQEAEDSVLAEEEEEEEPVEEQEDGAVSPGQAANRSVLVEEEEDDEDEEEEDEEEESGEAASLAQMLEARAEVGFPSYDQYTYREGDSNWAGRRRHFNYGGSPSCAWVWYENKNFNKHHRAFVRFLGRNQCRNERTSGKNRPGNVASAGYALSDRRCRVIFYPQKNCKGDPRVSFTPKSGGFVWKHGSARILSDFDKVDMDNTIESTYCHCKGGR